MKTQTASEAARALVARRRRVEGRCQDCGRQIWGYPSKLRCTRCKRQEAWARRKAKISKVA